jgi:DNA repair exonuclease SbcCD nuclease subunit
MRIAHIADVHVRSLSRHNEYVEVFTAFAQQCREREVDHIFVGGDVFHTKTSGMSPECIDFMCWWFKLLSSVAEVHVTLGNHDGNLSNFSRQDAITPIIKALNDPRVHLYKRSGVYQFAPGYNWCIFSLFDKERWKDVRPVPGMINIACYHGSVFGALTETDWLIEEGLTVDTFKEYDLCFLGDIHRMQFLATREVELTIDEADLNKYPGAEVLEELA